MQASRFVMVLSEFGHCAKHQVIIWLSWSCSKTLGQDYFFIPTPPVGDAISLTLDCLEFSSATDNQTQLRNSLHQCSEQLFLPTHGSSAY